MSRCDKIILCLRVGRGIVLIRCMVYLKWCVDPLMYVAGIPEVFLCSLKQQVKTFPEDSSFGMVFALAG